MKNRNEILSFTSFIVILSLSALAFNWCRVTPTFASEVILKQIYRAGIDFFLASMLALIATCLAWMRTLPLPAGIFAGSLSDSSFYRILFWMHWSFLSLALVLTLGAILSMILVIGKSDEDN
ncbi:hypothetical protein M4951_11345 [Blastopirellula sp. J2-11]|uniref:hypothetical protein n=1 Tax=Blastopirellula sp. J2-11 TaxID=2943192 RepID=UPI0021C7A678|nr:hypothetical protein [Blastopirellula sp. J2-11]UUO08887.1 hypothetical protein M4951_11345 [Blastopirellula sp. J2-11]